MHSAQNELQLLSHISLKHVVLRNSAWRNLPMHSSDVNAHRFRNWTTLSTANEIDETRDVMGCWSRRRRWYWYRRVWRRPSGVRATAADADQSAPRQSAGRPPPHRAPSNLDDSPVPTGASAAERRPWSRSWERRRYGDPRHATSFSLAGRRMSRVAALVTEATATNLPSSRYSSSSTPSSSLTADRARRTSSCARVLLW